MNDDIEDLLRESMQRFTADLRAPAGLMRRAARRRRRRRRLAMRSAAGMALAAGAAAATAVLLPGASHGGIDDAAYVVRRVNSELSASKPGQIAQMTITTSARGYAGKAVAATAREWSYGGEWRLVTYSAAGHPIYDEGSSASSGYTLVSYKAREWARQQAPVPSPAPLPESPGGCEAVVADLPLLFRFGLPDSGSAASSPPATVATALRTAVSCGTLAAAGRQRADGVDAIELTSRPGSPISETIWVSPGSYLPVRVAVRSAPGQPAIQQTADIRWLPPTAQNLASLTVPVPAGFRQVPLAQAVSPILPQALYGPKSRAVSPAPDCPAVRDPAGEVVCGRGNHRLRLWPAAPPRRRRRGTSRPH